MSPDDAALADMLHACRSACEFLGGCDRTEFLADRKTQSAVLHQLLLLGEAAKRLSPAFRDLHPHIPWREIAGLRDRLIHAYDRVDLEMVWAALEGRIPELRRFLEQQVPESGSGDVAS